jgi:hypothetical protein
VWCSVGVLYRRGEEELWKEEMTVLALLETLHYPEGSSK